MKRRHALAALGGAALSTPAQTASFALSFRDSFLGHWQVERGYTLAVAEAMPAEHYGFKPNPAQRSFGEQLTHLAAANMAYFNLFGLIPLPERPTGSDQEAARKYLNTSWDYTTAVLRKLAEKDLLRHDFNLRQKPHNGTDLLLRAYTHTAHHRGQAIVYLRIQGITPPTWAFEPTAR
jgi:uncharacterized damage-inducible protein DinB